MSTEIYIKNLETTPTTKAISGWGVLSNVDIGTPSTKTKTISIPGRNGDIDASEALTGYPTYSDRTITIELYVCESTDALMQSKIDDIYAFCHGQIRTITIESGYYFKGRIAVSHDVSAKRYIKVTLKCTCEPYAYKTSVTTKALSTGTVNCQSTMPTQLTLTVTSALSGSRGSTAFTYAAGTYKLYPLLVGSETWTITSGAGSLSYQEGKL